MNVSNETLNVINSFLEVFSFDDMLHGSSTMTTRFQQQQQQQLQQLDSTHLTTLKRINAVTSPIRSAAASAASAAAAASINNEIVSPLKSARPTTTTTSPMKKKLATPSSQSSSLASKYLNQCVNAVAVILKKQKAFSYIYNENANYKTQQLFVDSFLVINAVKSLANLAMHSFGEDQYGIVQQTLPEILTQLMNLQKVLEKFQQASYNQSGISFKILQSKYPNRLDLLTQKLGFILNESTYKLTQTFGTSLKSLSMSEETKRRLIKFYN